MFFVHAEADEQRNACAHRGAIGWTLQRERGVRRNAEPDLALDASDVRESLTGAVPRVQVVPIRTDLGGDVLEEDYRLTVCARD